MEEKKALIYKLTCNVTGKVYYGSTTRSINHRISRHKTSFRTGRGCKSKEIIENWNFKTKVLEEVNLENRLERESYYIKNFECVNKVIPCRTNKEYREDNKDKKKEYDKDYREKNKEKRKNQKKEYYENNKESISEKIKEKFTCECGSITTKGSKARHEKSLKHKNYLNTIN